MHAIAATSVRVRLTAVATALFVSAAAWVSLGAVAFRSPAGVRLGLLPVDARSLLIVAAAGVVVLAVSLRAGRDTWMAVAPLAVLFLPWLPFRVPPAFLMWTGALVVPVWLAVAIAVAYSLRTHVPLALSARHAPVIVAAASVVVFGTAAWSASAVIPGGDEPHYLLITQSLLHDHDLDLSNNYTNGDYKSYFGGQLAPDILARGRHGEAYSVHAPGVPVLVAPAFALGGYRGVVVLLILISAAACTLAWWLAWQETRNARAAWFGWAVVVLAAPFTLETFTVYPDGPGAAAVLTGFWALRRADGEQAGSRSSLVAWVLHGAAIAALPWMHTRFVLLAAALGVLVLVRLLRASQRVATITAFLSLPILSASLWLVFFYALYGTPNPMAPYGGDSSTTSLAFLPNGIGGLLFDQGFGLLATAPSLAIAFFGMARTRRWTLAWLVVAIPYTIAVGSYAMWWAGTSGPARFLVPLVLPLAIPAACAWQSTRSRSTQALLASALVVSAWITAAVAGGAGGLLAYHGRNPGGFTPAPWLEWANPIIDLARAAPSFVPLPAGTPLRARMRAAESGLAMTIPWLVCLGAAAIVIDRASRRQWTARAAVPSITTATLAIASMIAVTIVWWSNGVQPLTPVPAQLAALHRLGAGREIVLALSDARRISRDEAWNMRIEVPVPPSDGSDRTLARFPGLPAGSYTLNERGASGGAAAITAGGDNEPFPIATIDAVSLARGVRIDLPVAVRTLTVRGSLVGVDSVRLTAVSRAPASPPETYARHAARYGDTTVFFTDGRTTPEADGFWIWGQREGSVVFAGGSGTTLSIALRNGAADNVVTIQAGDWREDFRLAAGERRNVDIPVYQSAGATFARIRSSAGFRPSDVDPHSHDDRLLGVFVVMPHLAGH